MTGKADFAPEEWERVLQGPPTAGMIVITAQRGGTFRETLAMGKSYAEARQRHGESELLDEIASARPEVDRTRYRSPDDLRAHGLEHLRETVALLENKATPEEVDAYRKFVLSLADRVASAHREGDSAISDAEQTAIDEISSALAGGAG
jgi:hypothetical protein